MLCERPWIAGWMAFFGIGCGLLHVEHCGGFPPKFVPFQVAVASRPPAALLKDQ
jgi:hypothetical protein